MIHWPSAKTAGVGAARLLCVLALGAPLAGCDKCGDWWWAPDQSQSCKYQAPRSPQ
jgi:hypothetical protein